MSDNKVDPFFVFVVIALLMCLIAVSSVAGSDYYKYKQEVSTLKKQIEQLTKEKEEYKKEYINNKSQEAFLNEKVIPSLRNITKVFVKISIEDKSVDQIISDYFSYSEKSTHDLTPTEVRILVGMAQAVGK